jgi:hypothetical protein
VKQRRFGAWGEEKRRGFVSFDRPEWFKRRIPAVELATLYIRNVLALAVQACVTLGGEPLPSPPERFSWIP